MSVSVGRAKLADAMEKLMLHWRRVGESWDDEVHKEFEERYIEELKSRVRATLGAMETINEVLIRAKRDCGE